jgi:hypothetical protein
MDQDYRYRERDTQYAETDDEDEDENVISIIINNKSGQAALPKRPTALSFSTGLHHNLTNYTVAAASLYSPGSGKDGSLRIYTRSRSEHEFENNTENVAHWLYVS